ncbi:hypothetical protein [Streptomyces violaceusniger]|uniref:hypothetical protein n=1 Tax=Streptomyces violaceusniger TaxID=68280 RepID=UPI0036C136EF
MAAPKASPRPKPALENYHTVGQAAVRLNLKTQKEHDAGSTKGERWLRDGVNLKGWPCHRMSGQLRFSDTDLAEIAAMSRNAPDKRAGRPRRRRKAPAASVLAPAA